MPLVNWTSTCRCTPKGTGGAERRPRRICALISSDFAIAWWSSIGTDAAVASRANTSSEMSNAISFATAGAIERRPSSSSRSSKRGYGVTSRPRPGTSVGRASTRRCANGWRTRGIGHVTRTSPTTPSGRCRVLLSDADPGVRPGSFARSPSLLGSRAVAMRRSTSSVLRWERGFPANDRLARLSSFGFHTLEMSTRLSHLASRSCPDAVLARYPTEGYDPSTVVLHQLDRREHGMSRAEFGRATELAAAAIVGWEDGFLIPNAANERDLRLVRLPGASV